MASRWWLFIGIFMICSGIGMPAGIIILVIYFYEDIRKNFRFSQYTDNTYNINSVNISPGPDTDDKDDFDTPIDHMSKESKEEMR